MATMFENIESDEWRDILDRLFDSDDDVREAAFQDATRCAARSWRDEPSERAPDISPADQLALLEIGLTHEFPVQRRHWGYSAHKVIEALWCRPNREYPSIISRLYANASSPAKLASLVLLTAQESDEAATVFSGCIRSAGWPDSVYPRLFNELPRLLPFAKSLFPDLIIHADKQLPSVTNVFIRAMVDGNLQPENLIPAKDHIEHLVSEDVHAAQKYQRSTPGNWMHEEDYWTIRTRLGAAMDILGWIPGADLDSTRAALEFVDDQVRMFAMGALLRHGIEPRHELLQDLAGADDIRDSLYYLLKSRNRMDLFPIDYLTLDAFAASEMVGWLSYPSELGQPPEQLDLIAKLYGDEDGEKKVAYLWRFTSADGKSYAGLSGGYNQNAEIGPLCGSHTFSNFSEWDSKTEEEHIQSIFETLEDWELHSIRPTSAERDGGGEPATRSKWK